VLIAAMGSLGKVQEQQGQLREAEKTYRQALRLSGEQIEHGGQELPSAGKIHIFLSHLLYEWNRLEEAQEHANYGIQLCQQWEHIPHLLDGYLSLAIIQQARGACEAAYSTLTMAETLVEKERFVALKPDQKLNNMAWQITEAHIHLWFAQGDLLRIEQWIQEQHLTSDFLTPHNGHITLARLLLAQQQTTQARTLLEKLLQSVQKTRLELSLRSMLALALHAQGENRAATTHMIHVLEQAQSEGYIRTFVDLGSAMPALLRLTSTHNHPTTPYINKLLLAFGASLTSETSPTLAEPLSKRELEILRLVAAGMSNREIATTLVMTVGTIKWYINSIYSKLQAHGRVQAIERARTLHLLPLS
jgi:LuxR family transcriptional regulator, maltose regulon positive regulatory protein